MTPEPSRPSPATIQPVPVPELVDLAHALLPDEWEALNTIRRVFSAAGHRIVLVGGAVRNLVLGHKPNDLDLASDARPEETMKLFHHVIPTGIQHGTVTIRLHRMGFEITTFRVDGAYSDSRRPDSVRFTQDLLEDLKRRDFTVNAMALDLEHRSLIDPHGGRADLAARVIRTVGNPAERFAEDALRIVRGIRFACQLEFSLDPATLEAMRRLGPSLAGVSAERFVVELKKTLASRQSRRGLELMRDCGILRVFVPELDRLDGAGWQRTLAALDLAGKLPGLAADSLVDLGLGVLFRLGPGGQDLSASLRRLKLSRREMDLVEATARLCAAPWPDSWGPADWRRYLARCRPGSERHYISLCAAFMVADGVAGDPAAFLDLESRLAGCLQATLDQSPPRSIADLAIRGEDLVALGIPRSALMGRILASLLEEVLEQPERNTTEHLLRRAAELRDLPAAPRPEAS